MNGEISDQLAADLRRGNEDALAQVFSHYRDRLKRIIRFRLDYRIASRISDSDVLQETYIAAAKRLQHFSEKPELTPFLWLRLLVSQQLIDLHRRHLQAGRRDVRKEISIQHRVASPHTSMAIAAQLIGQDTGVSELISRAEQIERLESILNQMDPIDREVIALRHFEELSNRETANVLEIEPAAASKRYVRAMTRLGQFMATFQESEG